MAQKLSKVIADLEKEAAENEALAKGTPLSSMGEEMAASETARALRSARLRDVTEI